MKLIKLNIDGLYGYLSKSLEFNDRLSILVGPNGSGKTTVLNVINWVLNPDISKLCSITFQSIELDFEYNDRKYCISCDKNEKFFSYTLILDGHKYNPLTVRIMSNNLNYENLRPEEDEIETWKMIQSLPKPLFIGLDRLIFTVEDSVKYINEDPRRHKVKQSPIQRAVSMVKDHYIKQNSYILNLTKELNNNLILSNFNHIFTLDDFSKIINKPDLDFENTQREIFDLHHRISQYLLNFSGLDKLEIEKSNFDTYFENLSSSIHKLNTSNLSDNENRLHSALTLLNLESFKRLKRLMNDFDKFESRITTIMHRIDLFLKSVNFFLEDSGKRMFVDKNDGEIKITLIGTKNKRLSLDVDKLSSGEQQLIVIISYLVFYTSKDQLFLIDEPELSLHVKWQENLLKVLNDINGHKNQILVSTHSPLIVSNFRKNALILKNTDEFSGY